MQTKFKQTEIGMIPEDWEVEKLSDVVDILTGFPFKGEKYSKEGIRVLRGENVSIGFIRWDTEKRWNHSLKYLDKYHLKESDIVIGMDGSRVGQNRARIQKVHLPLILAQRVARLRAGNKVNQDFLYYIVFSDRFFNHVESVRTGTSIPHISAKQIGDLPLPIPSLLEQQAIAFILSSLDSKIELNQQMNKTLESIGQAIFKHWFIDFEFPNEEGKPYKSSGGEMVDSELGEIPKGWKVKPIDEIADFLNGLALQKFPAQEDEEYLPVIKIRELRKGITESSDKANLSIPEDYVVDDGDILFSWSGSLEVVIWTFGKGALNQHLFKVSSKDYPKWFYYYWILEHLTEYRRIAEGKATTMGHIQRHHLKSSLVLVPDQQTIIKMDKVLAFIIDKIIQINVESRSLSQIRDSLLPKLMSGKIRVPVEVKAKPKVI